MQELPLRERVANERRRLKTVREALSAALVGGAGGNSAYLPFYLAIGEYMDAAMHRLHIQDVRMGDMLRSRLGKTIGPEARAALDELDSRLARNQEQLQRFLQALERLRAEGASALDSFEATSRDYTAFIVANMGHHGAITDLARDLFTLDDWAYMAGITDEETSLEKRLYDKVFAAVPAGLVLPQRA